jgi:hypothetical protein
VGSRILRPMRLGILSFVLAGGLFVTVVGCNQKATDEKKAKKDKDDDDDDKVESKKEKKDKKGKSDDAGKKSDDGALKLTEKKKKDPEGVSSSKESLFDRKDGTPQTTGVDFAGVYRSTYGDVRVRQEGNVVKGKYNSGTFTCAAAGKSLDCSWDEGSSVGKAKLAKLDNGDLDGTWGNGGSATDGGRGLYHLLSAGDRGPSADDAVAGSFGGVYVSTWGDTTFTENGASVKGAYPSGTLDCKATGANLDCTWIEGSTMGRAKLVRQASGDLSGTWGNGASATDGGMWLFRRK